MKKPVFLSMIAIIFIFFSCSKKNKEVKSIEDNKNAFVLQKEEVSKTLDLPAELLPYDRAEINAKVAGYVRKVFVDIGDAVRNGQVLAMLDAPEIAAQLAEARAKYHESEARYRGSLDKFSRLNKAANEKGVVAEEELVRAKNKMLADSAALASAKSTARAYQELQAYLTIRAPFNGIVTRRMIDIGDFVGNGNHSTLFTVETPDRLRIRVHVPESFVNGIPQSKELAFTSDAIANKIFKAKLTRKSGSIDPDTRTELWEYEYTNNTELKPGMYCMAKLNLNRPTKSFVVPYTAVVTSLEKKFVIRIKNEKAEWVDVREGISLNDGEEIFGDLVEGDTLLTRGSEEIKPASMVKLKVQNQSIPE